MTNLKTGYSKKQSTPSFPKNEYFLAPDTHTWTQEMFGKFGVLCFLETPVLRFALLPNYRRLTGWSFNNNCFIPFSTAWKNCSVIFFIALFNIARSSRLQMFFKIDVLKTFANFTEKQEKLQHRCFHIELAKFLRKFF